MFIIETERLIVRKLLPGDEEAFFLLNSDEEIMRYIRPVKNREESDLFFKEVLSKADEDPLFGRWMVFQKKSGDFIGTFSIIPFQDSGKMHMGYALLSTQWGNGYATELTFAGLEYVFTKTDLHLVYAYTEEPNQASQKVLLKTGFIQSGSIPEEEKLLIEFRMTKEEYKSKKLLR